MLLEGLETVIANVMVFLREAGEGGGRDEVYAAAVASCKESLVQVLSPSSCLPTH